MKLLYEFWTQNELENLKQLLFPGGKKIQTYVIIEKLRDKSFADILLQYSDDAVPLYPYTENDEVIESGPHLVVLNDKPDLVDWILEHVYGNHKCIFLQSDKTIEVLAEHLSTMTIAVLPEGDECYFRYYDPVILHHWLQAAAKEQRIDDLFGPVQTFLFEAEEPWNLTVCGRAYKEHNQLTTDIYNLRQAIPELPVIESSKYSTTNQMVWCLTETEEAALVTAAQRNYILNLRDHLFEYKINGKTDMLEVKQEIDSIYDMLGVYGIDKKHQISQIIKLAFLKQTQWQSGADTIKQILSQTSIPADYRLQQCQKLLEREI